MLHWNHEFDLSAYQSVVAFMTITTWHVKSFLTDNETPCSLKGTKLMCYTRIKMSQ